MLAKEIKVGAVYVIRHHDGQFCKVRVEVIQKKESFGYRNGSITKTRYLCTKLSTGNTITVKSASKFRREYVEHTPETTTVQS